MKQLRLLRDTVAAGVRLLSVLPQELPGAIERLQSEAKQHRRTDAALQTDLARANLKLTVGEFLILQTAFAAVVGMLAWLTSGVLIVGLQAAAALAAGLALLHAGQTERAVTPPPA